MAYHYVSGQNTGSDAYTDMLIPFNARSDDKSQTVMLMLMIVVCVGCGLVASPVGQAVMIPRPSHTEGKCHPIVFQAMLASIGTALKVGG